jgi:hypothetical protein
MTPQQAALAGDLERFSAGGSAIDGVAAGRALRNGAVFTDLLGNRGISSHGERVRAMSGMLLAPAGIAAQTNGRNRSSSRRHARRHVHDCRPGGCWADLTFCPAGERWEPRCPRRPPRARRNDDSATEIACRAARAARLVGDCVHSGCGLRIDAEGARARQRRGVLGSDRSGA